MELSGKQDILMWWNSIRGRKIGFIVRVVSITTWIPFLIGTALRWVLGLKSAEGDVRLAVVFTGYGVMFIAFIIIWILRAVWIWLNDDTGYADPWKWGKE